MHVQSWERKNQAHVDLDAHSVGKEAFCVHVPGNFKMECFLQREVCIEGDIPLHKQLGGAVLYSGWRSVNKWPSKNKGRGNRWR